MRGDIHFLLGNDVTIVSGIDPQTTVLDWLRTRARRPGSKEGCAEGDCGACTVVLGELIDGKLRYRAFNSCILLMPALDGRQLLTVEDLAAASIDGSGLHPVQQAMVDQHGSQCGFCTPGFVMSLFALFQDTQRFNSGADGGMPSRHRIDEALAGNLCRCTGYAPIVRAARQALASPAEDEFTQRSGEIADRLSQLQQAARQAGGLHLQFDGRQYFAPTTLAQLWQLLEQHPDAQMVAGATDVGLWMTKQLKVFDVLINVCEVVELQGIRHDQENNCLVIGAAARYSDVLDTLVDHYPTLRPMLTRLGAVQVRNAGTIGGNIANGSPIGDMPPALIALGSRLVLSSATGRREIALEDFFIDYGKQDLQPGECVEAIKLPVHDSAGQPRTGSSESGHHLAVYKISKRFDQDISALCAAIAVRLEDGKVASVRLCFGGMAGTPKRAVKAEQALIGQTWKEATILLAQQAMGDDFTPLSDWRASSEYRMLAAQNMLMRFYLESSGETVAQLPLAHSA